MKKYKDKIILGVCIVAVIVNILIQASSGYEHSVYNFLYKVNVVNNTVREYKNLVGMVTSLNNQLDNVKATRIDLESRKVEVSADWDLHIPSLLVLLEQNAKFFNLNLRIENYNEFIGQQPTETNLVTPGEIMENEVVIEEPVSDVLLNIKVHGDYTDIKEYINFLEHVDFIKPVEILVTSDGDKVTASIILDIFRL